MATPTNFTPKRLITPVQPGLTISTLYTVPASTTTQLTEIVLDNSATTAVTIDIHLVISAGTADNTNLILKAVNLPIDGTPLVYEFSGLYMNTGDTVQALASVATQATVHLTGVELT